MASARMRAPRLRACSMASNTSTVAASPITKPSRSRSKGLEACSGSSLRVVSARAEQNDATDIGEMQDSAPPTSTTSAPLVRMYSIALAMAWPLEAQAVTVHSFGPVPHLPATRPAQKSSTPVPIGVTGPMPVTAMRRLSGTCGDLGPEDLHGLPDGRDVLELRVGHLDLEALLDGHDRAHQVDRVQPEVVEQVGLRRYRLGLDLQAVHEHFTQGLQNFLV